MKRIGLIAAVAAIGFMVGYGVVAKAIPPGGLWGRGQYVGYFFGGYDDFGDFVWSNGSGTPGCGASGGNAIPTSINTAAELINFVKCKLNSTNASSYARNQDRTGAAFIIQTMISPHNAPNRNKPPTAGQIAEWESRINFAASQGWILWGYNFAHSYNSYYQGGAGGGANPDDDAFYDDAKTSFSIGFRNASGTVVYGIRYQCANPVGTGNMGPIPDNPAFDMDGYTRITAGPTNPTPGQTVTFGHFVYNPSSGTSTNVTWRTYNSISGAQTGGPVTLGPWGPGVNRLVYAENYTVPAGTPPGTQICRHVTWTPDTQAGGTGVGEPACVMVPINFTLTPSVSPSSTIAQQGDTVTFTYRISNGGPHTTVSAPSVCKAVGKLHPPGSQLPEEFIDRNSDAGQTPPSPTCPAAIPGNNVPVTVLTESLSIGAELPGTRICRSLVINPYNSSGGDFRASAEACVMIAKTPWVHFMGGDVWAGGGIAAADGTCTTNTNAKITTVSNVASNAGSTVEYGAFALGTITRFGSGSKPMHNSADFSALGRRLTFSNNTTTLGRFGAPQHCIDDYSALYEGAPTSSATSIGVATACNRTLHITGNVTFTAASVPAGCKQAYLVDGDVTITGALNYINANPTYASLADIPSLIIISKGNIFVGAASPRLSGIYVARNTFYTCYPKPSPPTVSTCNILLTVNGAIIANNIDLYRTSGADGATPATRQLPAEIFNLSPEVFLNNGLNDTTQPSITTSESRELPPRF